MTNATIDKKTYFLYDTKNNEIMFLITDGHDFIEEFNITNYDFTEKDFNNFVNVETLSNNDIETYKNYYNVKTLLGVYLLNYLGY